MKVDVQGWLNQPANNHGWIVIGNEDDIKVAKRFDSRENADTSTRPVLTVTFTPLASTGACCTGRRDMHVALHPGSGCAGTYQGVGTTCEPNPCPQPTGACCLPDAAATCVEVTAASCEGQGAASPRSRTIARTSTVRSCWNLSRMHCRFRRWPRRWPARWAAPPPTISRCARSRSSFITTCRDAGVGLRRRSGGATYPGPTIEATAGVPVTVNWINDLRDSGGTLRTDHFLPVDPCPTAPTIRERERSSTFTARTFPRPPTVTRKRRSCRPAGELRVPEPAASGDAVVPRPRARHHATERLHGLAGFYLLRDAAEKASACRRASTRCRWSSRTARSVPTDPRLSVAWQEHFFGDTVLVNGKVWPYLEVKRGKYRFRMLNGSTSRTYALTLSNGAPFTQIGTDGGLLPAPVSVSTITIGPGERADVIVNFAAYAASTEIVMTNSAPAPFPGGDHPADIIPT